jgi:hypothetical protein
MNLQQDETEIVGEWILDGGQMRVDKECIRIEHLTSSVLQ